MGYASSKTAAIRRALLRFFTQAEIETAYRDALAAFIERSSEVVITSAAFEGGNSAGQIVGNPEELMRAAESALEELGIAPVNATTTETGVGSRGAVHNSYRSRRISP